jgi:hypothetical protein
MPVKTPIRVDGRAVKAATGLGAVLLAAGCMSSANVAADGDSYTPNVDEYSVTTPHQTKTPKATRKVPRHPARHAAVSISLSASTMRVGSTVAISGRVAPRLPGHTVYLQRRTAYYGWVTIKRQELGRYSRFHFSVSPHHVGSVVYRVRDPKIGRRVLSAVSDSMRLNVHAAYTKPPAQPAQSCTPGYSPCIPPAYDVDCAGGSGNGPEYVEGPVYVTGDDPYELDADGDGVACEW